MRLVTYRRTVETEARLGVVIDDLVVDVTAIGRKAGCELPATMLAFIDLGPSAIAGLRDALGEHAGRLPAGVALPLSNVRLLAEHPRTLRDAFFAAFARRGRSLLQVYHQRWVEHDLFQLAENAFELDRRFYSWRQNHILMVRRQIGIRARGTGGTFFQDYLAATTQYYFFPELFEFRNELTADAGGEVMPKTP